MAQLQAIAEYVNTIIIHSWELIVANITSEVTPVEDNLFLMWIKALLV